MNEDIQFKTSRGRRNQDDVIHRRRVIVDLISNVSIASQAELARLLERRGLRATQATLSRDLKALGIGKVPTSDDGYAYVIPTGSRPVVDQSPDSTDVIAVCVHEVRIVGNLALVRTVPGKAQAVGKALDRLGWSGVSGTVSGEDTVLVVADANPTAVNFRDRLAELVGRSFP